MFPVILRQVSEKSMAGIDENHEAKDSSVRVSFTGSRRSLTDSKRPSVCENPEGEGSSWSLTVPPKSQRKRPSLDEFPKGGGSSSSFSVPPKYPRQSRTGRKRPSLDEFPKGEGSTSSFSLSPKHPRRGRRPCLDEKAEGEGSSSSFSLSPKHLRRGRRPCLDEKAEGEGFSSSFSLSPKYPRRLTSSSRLTPRRSIRPGLGSPGMSFRAARMSYMRSPSMSIYEVAQKTKEVRDKVTESTEAAYENSPWCALPRFLGKNFPRIFSFLFGVVLPLWMLIAISWGFGIILASDEAPHEQESNHAILRTRARLNRTFVNRTDLAQLPVQCFFEYLNQTDRSKLEQQINESVLLASSMENDANITSVNETNVINDDIKYTSLGDALDQTEEEMYRFMLKCQQEQSTEVMAYLELQEKDGDSADDSLSFNWNRCWPREINDEWAGTRAVYFPPLYLIEASRPAQQEATVETEFVRILDEAEKECLDLGGGADECFEQALQDASEGAGNICHDNVEGTSWFFFTLMTTVGYGNQTPVTDEGRMLIYTAGTASLILFAAVLGSSGYIIKTIFDDFVSRLGFAPKFLQHSFAGVVIWGGIWIGWAYSIAYGADGWWQRRLPDFDVDVEDTMWFAFLSTTTIGLGDYFLQPEVMFASDALSFSFIFLVGFVFLSTFLSELGGFLFNILPKREASLETRLKKTSLIVWHGCDHWSCKGYFQSRSRPRPHEEEETDRNETEPKETDYGSSEQQQQEMQQQLARVEIFKSQLPNRSLPPPLNTMMCPEGEKSVGDLVDEEVMILQTLLESAEQRRTELSLANEKRNPSVVGTKAFLRAVGPPPLEATGSEKTVSMFDSVNSALSA